MAKDVKLPGTECGGTLEDESGEGIPVHFSSTSTPERNALLTSLLQKALSDNPQLFDESPTKH